MADGEVYEWLPGSGLVSAPPDPKPLLVADSWLLTDGLMRGIDLHRARFLDSCAKAADLRPEQLGTFWDAAIAALPRDGRWFPRVELIQDGVLRLRVRPVPEGGTSLRLLPIDGPDARVAPYRKGPDLDTLAGLRRRAVAEGADDALLTTASGFALESTTASLLWWAEDVLCVPAEGLPTLPGVTTRLIRQRATELGIPVRRRVVRVADLDGHETWLVNALHGIRPVVAWVGAPVDPGPARRVAEWQRWWRALARPLPEQPISLRVNRNTPTPEEAR